MAELPTGAVTFLFTDVEGSTRLVKQLRERYSEVLAEHQRLLREAFAAHGGHEIDTQGDSFFVAFASARDAVLAAVEGQLALASHPWPEGVQVKVRMGLHTGQAVATNGRYTGLAVHRAARIQAAAHGGQVLVSQATQTLLEDEEEDLHVILRDLGEQRLKDLDRPVRLYQLVGNGLLSEFPPLRDEAELAVAADETPARSVPLYRRPLAVVAAVALAAIALAATLVLARSDSSGLAGVDANNVGVVDPETNEIVAQVPVGIRPGAVAAGIGAVWVANRDDRSVTRIDARRRAPAGTIALENRTPTGIAVGGGAVWVAHGLLGQLSRVDPQFNRVAKALDAATRSEDGSVAVGEGSVWAVFGDSSLVRVDPTALRVVGSAFAGTAPAAIVVGGGAVWVANSADATVDRFNPATFEQGPVRSIAVGARPTALAFGSGALWVGNSGDGTVTRVDPSSGATRTIDVGEEPTAVAAGAGAIWVANRGDGTVSRIDPSSGDVEQTIEIGTAPAGVAVAGGLVWVTAEKG